MTEDMAEYMREEEEIRDTVVEEYQRNEKLLLNLQSGIATLFEKLKDVRLKPVSLCIHTCLPCFFGYKKELFHF